MSTTLRGFYAELRLQGFKRSHRGRGENDCHIYQLTMRRRIKLELQLWPDGEHRVSHYVNERMNTVPTYFTTVEGMQSAIGIERRQARRRVLKECA